MRKFFWGVIIAVAGGLLWASNLGYISLSFRFSRDWPIIIVAIGLMSIWEALFGKHWWGHKFRGCGEKRVDLSKILEDLEKGSIDAEEAAKRMGGK
ncbi:MAG: DUF5668 domain-containing protein [Elusimicrobiales bacterium]|nr:DUF5668 domain-containing protein [Elusimicrobiales bacterium]